MNKRLQEIIQYKTGGRQKDFAELMGWTPQYVFKLLKGENFGLSPVLKICEALPELNARWLLTGQGDMLTEDLRSGLRREALKKAQAIMDFERLIPVMTPDELRTFEKLLTGQREAVFSPDTLNSLNERASERVREINAKFAAAAAKSDELCRQRTVKK